MLQLDGSPFLQSPHNGSHLARDNLAVPTIAPIPLGCGELFPGEIVEQLQKAIAVAAIVERKPVIKLQQCEVQGLFGTLILPDADLTA